MSLRLLGLAALLLAACTETVGFVTLDLTVPERNPAIICAKDPRRAVEITIRATCGGEVRERTASVDGSSISLSDVPLGSCTIEVDARNQNGRTVLGGSVTLDIERGDNDPAKVQLVEEQCDSTCDTDGDKLPDQDEKALGTDASSVDSDGDGLEDGLELYQCCTDPMLPEGQCRELLIQRVEPGYGTVYSAVMIKASAPLEQPVVVSVGGQPLQNLIADSTIAFGTVAPGSALGEVELVSGGGKVTYEHLFAVLRDTPQSLVEISNKATGIAPVMYQAVDQTFVGARQYVLGRSYIKSSANASSSVVPILLMLDHLKQEGVKAVVALTGEPVAVAASGDRVLVALDVGGKAEVVLYTPSAAGASLGLPKKLKLDNTQLSKALAKPVELVVEPTGDTAQLLLGQHLVRFRFDTAGVISQIKLVALDQALGPVGNAGACTGMTYHEQSNSPNNGTGITFLSCNLDVPCPPGTKCEPQGAMMRIEVGKCLALGSVTAPVPQSCATLHMIDSPRRLVGNPVIEPKGSQVFLLSTGGVVAAALDKPSKMMSTIVPWNWAGKTDARDVMAAWGTSLYVVDGAQVWRMEPGQLDPARRRGKSFVVGYGLDEAQMLAVSPEGSALSLVKATGGFSWLMGVCLSPCK